MSRFRRVPQTEKSERDADSTPIEPQKLPKPLATRDPRVLIAAGLLHELEVERSGEESAHDLPTWIEFLSGKGVKPCSE